MAVSKYNIYHIIKTVRGVRLEDVYWTYGEDKVNRKFNELLKKNKEEVIFPAKYTCVGTEIVEADYELMIIKVKENENPEKTFRDKDNNLITYTLNSNEWVIYDRAPYDVEETFWVYGYHPTIYRKTFTWIFDNMILPNSDKKLCFKTVAIMKNKLLIDSEEKLDMVICKNVDDCIRLYNMLESWCKKKKIKYVGFIGDVWNSKSRKYWGEKVISLTHWAWSKIKRNTTKP